MGHAYNLVSIQLMSPASGDDIMTRIVSDEDTVSIQLMSPASGDSFPSYDYIEFLMNSNVSIQLMSPASGDGDYFQYEVIEDKGFPFN